MTRTKLLPNLPILSIRPNFTILPKFQNVVQIVKIGWNCENLVEIVKIDCNCEHRLELCKSVEIVKISWNCENWMKLWNLWNCETFEIVKIDNPVIGSWHLFRTSSQIDFVQAYPGSLSILKSNSLVDSPFQVIQVIRQNKSINQQGFILIRIWISLRERFISALCRRTWFYPLGAIGWHMEGSGGISIFHSAPYFYVGASKLQAVHSFHIHTCIVAVPGFKLE